ncbi:MAG: ankyrin repeat domain-containing protein [Kiritimatiellae bacterium]|nr:ankyrin repeat domain-containing protein [Kiritimatiellia bacterium]
MTYVDPIASMRKRDWALVIACCCVWLSHWIEIGNAGDASALGVVQVPFRITASCFTFLRCAWVATLVCLLLSCLFNGNQTKKLSWLAKVSWVLSAATLFIKYEDFSRSTFLDGVDMLPLLALAVVGWVQGVLISIFIDFARCIRSKRYAFEKGLPRIPDQVMRGMKGTLLLFCLLVLLGILIMVFWCRSSLLTQLCVVTGMVFLGTLSQFMSVSGKCRLELDNQKRILFDMVDRRIQMKRQSVPYKDSPLLRKEFERPSELQTFLSKGMQSHFNYEIEWKYVNSVARNGEPMLRFSYQEDGASRETLVPEKVVRPYVKSLSGNDYVSLSDVPKDVVEKAATYASIDVVFKCGGISLLWACINDSRREDLDAIIRAEPDVNRAYGAMGGWTVLMLAVAQGFTYGVILLLKYAANPNARNAYGMTSFLIAVRYDNLRCVQLLYDAGANLTETNAEGANALVVAARHRAMSVVPFLIAHGVDVGQKDIHGRTALYYAQNAKCGEIAIMLRKKMAGDATKKKSRHKR